MFENTESGLLTDDGIGAEDFNKVYESAPVQPEEPEKHKKWALRDRLRSRVLWAAVVGCVITLFSALNLWERIGITAAGFREIAASVGSVLAAFGVFNDPTSREAF